MPSLSSHKPLHIAVVGLGTVGSGTVNLLQRHAELYQKRTHRKLVVSGVSARDANKSRDCDISTYHWENDPMIFAQNDAIDVIIETVGGETGLAADLVETALRNGKTVVTANKALIAARGIELAELATASGGKLYFEAAVAAAIPVLKVLRESLASNNIISVCGILNGTCNYILSRMEKEDCDFDTILKDAQAEGFAEADPSMDIDAIDTAQKTAIIAALAFGVPLNRESMVIDGIRHIRQADITEARDQGCVIRLIGRVERAENGTVIRKVSPELVPLSQQLASVSGPGNAILITSDAAGDVFLQGAGAGMYATASAVVADVLDAARGIYAPPFGIK